MHKINYVLFLFTSIFINDKIYLEKECDATNEKMYLNI